MFAKHHDADQSRVLLAHNYQHLQGSATHTVTGCEAHAVTGCEKPPSAASPLTCSGSVQILMSPARAAAM